MNDSLPDPLEDQLPLLAAQADEALAAGAPRATAITMMAPPELQPRIDKGLACIQLLRQFWNVDVPQGAPGQELPRPLPWQELGRFEIRAELGRGGFGVVYLAYDPRLQREIALKVPRLDFIADPGLRQRFQHEACAAAGLDHPNIVPVHEAGEVGPVCYIASAYCPGVTLAAWLHARTEPVPIADATQLICLLADAVQHAHERGLLHRDLKPANILLQQISAGASTSGKLKSRSRLPADAQSLVKDFIPKITDFGLAKFITGGEGEQPTAETKDGAILGTPQYMAPEQAESKSGLIGPATDVYALGAMLYELLTARPPFQADSVLELLVQVKLVEPLAPGRLRPRLPRDLETICLHCLEKEPRRRYSSAAALAADLRRYLAHEPIQARPVSSPERCLKWARRHPGVAAMAAMTVVVTIAGISGMFLLWRQAEHEATNARNDRDIAVQERANSDDNFRKAKEVVDQLTQVGRDLAEQPGMHKTARELLEKSLGFYKEFLAKKSTDPLIRLQAARAYFRVAQIFTSLHKIEDAQANLTQGLALIDALVIEFPEREVYLNEKANAHLEIGDRLRSQKKTAQAKESFNQAILCWRELCTRAPANPHYQAFLAITMLNWCSLGAATPADLEKAFTEAIRLEENATRTTTPGSADYRFQLAVAYDDYGMFLLQRKENERAKQECGKALAIRKTLHEAQPKSAEIRVYLARSYRNMGRISLAAGDRALALSCFRQGGETANNVVSEFPDFPGRRSELAALLVSQAELLDQPAQRPAKEALFRRIIEHYDKLVVAVPSEPFFLYSQGTYEILLARLLRLMSRPAEAETHFRVGLTLRFKLVTENPADAGYQQSVVRDALELKRWLVSEERFQEAGGVLRKLVETLPANASACNNMAWYLVTCEDASHNDAVAALPFAKVANLAAPADANIWNTLGVVYYRLGQYQESGRALDESMRLKKGGIPSDWLFRAMTHWRLDEKPQAFELYDRAVAKMADTKSSDPELIRFRAEAAELIGKKK